MDGSTKNDQATSAEGTGECRPDGGAWCCGRAGGRGGRRMRPPPFMIIMPLLFLANLCALSMLIRKVNAFHREIAKLGPRSYQAKGD